MVPLDTGFELGYVINEETSDVSKWPTYESSIYQVKYNPIKVYSDGTPTYNLGVSGALDGIQYALVTVMIGLSVILI